MRMPTFNKAEPTAICIKCKKNTVARSKALRPCSECLKKNSPTTEVGIAIGHRDPAAVIEPVTGAEVFVDKFGKEVKNPGYDLKNDPRGWGFTGKHQGKRVVIK
jgi:hypothetical protein